MWFKTWYKNARSIALPQSLMPAITALVLGLRIEGFNFVSAIVGVLGVAFAHLAMNLADDYYDFLYVNQGQRGSLQRQGIRARTHKCPYLTDGSATIKDLRNAIIVFLLLAAICGAIVAFLNFSSGLIIIVLLTLLLGLFYSAPPLRLSYHGLGELVIGLIFGPLIMIGISLAACAQVDKVICVLSIPMGLFVTNILFTHSYIDQEADKAANKMTFARLLERDSYNLSASAIFNFIPFVVVIIGISVGLLHWAYLFVLTLLPLSFWLVSSLYKFSRKIEIDSTKPPVFLGPIPDWDKYVEAGLDWFLVRWLTARNIVMYFSLIIIIVTIVLRLCL